MVPSHSPQQAVLAAQLADELGEYGTGMDRLLDRWDPRLYRDLSECFDRMQMYADALPRLSSSFTELLICRVELLHALWGGSPTRVAAKHACHQVLVREVMRKAMPYVAGSQA